MFPWYTVGMHKTEGIKLLSCQVKFTISQGLNSNNICLIFGILSGVKCPLFEILGPMSFLQIYPFLSKIMDEYEMIMLFKRNVQW